MNFKEIRCMHVAETKYKMEIFMRFKPTLVNDHSMHNHQWAKFFLENVLKYCININMFRFQWI